MLIFWGLYHLKLFTQPDKSQIEKKVQELERILSALQKNSVRAILFLCLFVCFHINRSNRINTKALECIVMPLKTRLEVIIFWNQQWFTEKKKNQSAMFPLIIDKKFYVFKSDGQEISTKILISWQELKNRFLSFFVHK